MSSNAHHCPKCAKPLATAERLGSLTSFLFSEMHCRCSDSVEEANKAQIVSDSLSCQRCGKVIAGARRKGSFTAFLLKDMRCQCNKPLTKTPTLPKTEDSLKTRFHRPADASYTRKPAHETRRQTRAAQLLKSDAQLVTLTPGQVIGGCYQLSSLIGRGGMGLVYKARHNTLGRTCALKFLAPSLVSPTSWQLFQKEAQIISSLNHPTICHIYDLGIHANSLPFYTMDYLAGMTVDQVLSDDGPLSVGATVEIAIKVAEGLSYAHRRAVVHKDIKPANIMLVPDDQGNIGVKLLDFGIAQLSEAHSAHNSNNAEIVGSAAYMSPEQFTDGTVDLRSDIYSLGCTIFETLTGRTPFYCDDLKELQDKHQRDLAPLMSEVTGLGFPSSIEAVVKKCLEKVPENRYQNANELVIDLQRILNHKELQFASDQLASIMMDNEKVDNAATNRSVLATIGLSMIGVTTLLLILAGTVYVTVDFYAKKSGQGAQQAQKSIDRKLPAESMELSSINKAYKNSGPDYLQQHLLDGVKKVQHLDKTPQEAIDPAPGEAFGSVGLVVEQFGKQAMQTPEPKEIFKSTGMAYYKGVQKSSSGTKERVYDFGEKLVPGVLMYYKDVTDISDPGRKFSCKGIVKLPPDGDVVYELSGDLANPEAVLLNFKSGDLQGINAGNTKEHPAEVVKAIQRFKGLRYLRLSGFQQGPATANIVNAMTTLKNLVLIDWHNELKYPLLVSPALKLKVFAVEYGRGSLQSFFAQPAAQNGIEAFKMIEIPINKEDLIYLSRLKNLRALTLTQVHLDNQLFKLLSQCKKLDNLEVRDHLLDFGPDKIQILSQLTRLKAVLMECDIKNNGQIKQLEHELKIALPEAQVVVR